MFKVSHAGVLAELVGDASDLDGVSAEISLVNFYLVLESVVTDTATSIDNVLNHGLNAIAVLVEAEHEVTGDGGLLVGGQVLVIVVRNLVHVGQLTEGTKEVISRNSSLTFEESEPKDLSALSFEDAANFGGQVVVHDVFEVDLVQIVSPWVQD